LHPFGGHVLGAPRKQGDEKCFDLSLIIMSMGIYIGVVVLNTRKIK